MTFGQLPAYTGGNALNFGPVQNALSDVAQTNQNYAHLGLDAQRLGMEQQKTQSQISSADLEQQATYAHLHGGAAQSALALPEDQQPAAAQAIWNSTSQPVRDHLAANGLNPADHKAFLQTLVDEAKGYQNPLDLQAKQDAHAQAVQTLATGKYIKTAPGETLTDAKTGKVVDQPDNNVITNLADAIQSGKQPPVFTSMGRGGIPAAVKSELQRRGVDVSNLENQWTRAQAQIKSLNGAQLTRYAGLTDSVDKTIDEANGLADQLQQSGIPELNKAKLFALIQTRGNTPEGQLATKYMTAIGTLKEEFANLAQGGNTPTEPAWALANQQINGNYGVKQLGASLGEVQRLIRYRKNAIPGINTLGPGAPNRYAQPPGAQSASGAAPPAAAASPGGAPPPQAAQPQAGLPPGNYVYDPATRSVRPAQ